MPDEENVTAVLTSIEIELGTKKSLLALLAVRSSRHHRFCKMASYYNIPSGSGENDVYLGFWINRSLSQLHSATLTMDRRQGGLFIAFLALYVGTMGRSLWKLVRFFLHLVQSKQQSEDGVYHQRQAVLRNTPLPEDAILGLAFVNWHWRGRSAGAIRRLAPSILFAVLISGFAFVAGNYIRHIYALPSN